MADRALSGKTAITFAYELGLRRSSARWKANEKFNPKIHKSRSNSLREAPKKMKPQKRSFRASKQPPKFQHPFSVFFAIEKTITDGSEHEPSVIRQLSQTVLVQNRL